jgi:carbon-monoxide dehydrogenase small subunit
VYKINLTVNGKIKEFEVDPRIVLLELLREEMGLTGTKIGCSCGSCGACTVILDGKAVKSCSVLAVQANGREVQTVESLAKDGKLHALQEAFIKHHGTACGYCTPGMLMELKAFLDHNPEPSEHEIIESISGHLCRCGTYPKIVEAALEAARVMRGKAK